MRSVYARPRDVMPRAKAAALKAVELDDGLPEGHVSLGSVKMYYDFDWTGAEREFRRATQLNRNSADAHHGYALYLAAVARPAEAVAEIKHAEELDPLSLLTLTDAGWVFYLARQYDRAAEECRKAIELDPNFWYASTVLGLAYEKLGRFEDAIAVLEKAQRLDKSPTILEMLGGAYAAAGKTAEARRVLAVLTERSSREYVCPYEVSTVYVGLGDKSGAIDWLEKAEEERADCVPWIRADSKLDPLRSNPRFAKLLDRCAFPK